MMPFASHLTSDRGLLMGTIVLGLAALYVLALDQGFFLSLFQGDLAYQMNLLHELVHDARHVAAFPCH